MTNKNSKIIKARINTEKFEFVARCLMLDAGYLMLDVWCSYLVKRKAEFVRILIYYLQLTIEDLELLEDREQKTESRRQRAEDRGQKADFSEYRISNKEFRIMKGGNKVDSRLCGNDNEILE